MEIIKNSKGNFEVKIQELKWKKKKALQWLKSSLRWQEKESKNLKMISRNYTYTIWRMQKKKDWRKNEANHRDLDNIKNVNIHVIWVSKEEEREKSAEGKKKVWEIMTKNAPNLKINITPQTQETWWILWRINTKLSTLTDIVVKLLKAKEKEKILKAASEN